MTEANEPTTEEVYKATAERMAGENWDGNIEGAARREARIQLESRNELSAVEEETVEKIVAAVTQRFESEIDDWNFKLYPDWSLDADACPVCGSEGFFNVAAEAGAQIARKGDPGWSGEHLPDDGPWAQRATYVSCGNCMSTLFDDE